MKKRILQYGFSSNPGGIETIGLNVFRNIDRNKFTFDFLIAEDNIAYENELMNLGGNVIKITNREKNIFQNIKELFYFFKNNAKYYDAIHCSYCRLYSILPIIFAKFFGIKKIILHARCNNFNTDKFRLKFFHNVNRYVANFIVSDFMAVSDSAAKFMFTNKKYKKRNFKLLKNPIELEKFKYNEVMREKVREKLNINDSFVLGHIGAFLPVKNHEFILKVFKKISDITPDSKLILIGGGILESKIHSQAQKLGIENKIIFTGKVNNPQDYLQAMDAFIFPSLYESFGNVLIEAQISGLPCFASNTIPKEVKVTDNVHFISLEEESYWAELILQKRQKARKGYYDEIKKQGFSITDTVRNYEKLYD